MADDHVLMTGPVAVSFTRRAAPWRSGGPGPRPSHAVTELITFGCRLNAYETEVMRGHAAAAGLGDAVIVNTCAVTAEADAPGAPGDPQGAAREARGAASSSPAAPPRSIPPRFAAMPEVDQVLGNEEKLPARDASARLAAGDRRGSRSTTSWRCAETAGHLVDGFEGRARAFVQVQQGCDHRCTFCIIPYGRGNTRSVPMGEIVAQVRRLVEQALPGDRADRRRHHRLWRRSAGPPAAGPAGAPPAGAGAGAAAAAPLLARPGRDRRGSLAPDRRGAAADAASASLACRPATT